MYRKTFKYRLYPNKEHSDKLHWTLDRCREVYNAALQERRDTWNNIKRHPNFHDLEWRKQAAKEHAISLYDQQNQLAPMKQERTEYLELSAAHLLNDVCKRVDLAFKAFFDRVNQGRTPGYPRFRGKARYDSFTYPDTSGWKLDGKTLHLTRIGDIKVKLHRPVEGKIKTCTIKQEGTHWYVTFSCECEDAEKLPLSYEDVGIDVGINNIAALSTGEMIDNPRWYRKGKKKLERAQQSLARKKRNSHRRKKAVQRVAKCHRKVRNQRKDFWHKQSRELVNRYQVIAFEDLSISNLVRRPKPKQDAETGQYLPNGASSKSGLNTSISDGAWGMFTSMVKAKAAWAGRTTVFVNPYKTSQICSACHKEGKHKDLSERTHICEHCGIVLDRDTNAAINILQRGMCEAESIVLSERRASQQQQQQQARAVPTWNSASYSPGRKGQRKVSHRSKNDATKRVLPSSPSQASLWTGT